MMFTEEISLSEPVEDFEEDRSPDEVVVEASLSQHSRMRGRFENFTLSNNHSLCVESQGLLQDPKNYAVDTRFLDPEPRRVLKIRWAYFVVFALSCILTWVFVFTSLVPKAPLLAAILGLGSIASLILGIYSSYDRLVFYSHAGRVPLVIMYNSAQDRSTRESFVATLVENIEVAREDLPGGNKALIEELKEHRRLMEEGIISDKRYTRVKRRLLSQHR